MDLTDPYRPRPFSFSLVFAARRGGHIADLRRGIRMCLSRYYPTETAWRMSASPTYNYLFSQNRKERCIVLTTDAPFSEGVLLDLYARLSQRGGQLRTPLTTYEVCIEGNVDVQRLQALTAHYFWTNALFERHIGRSSERHLLN